MRLTRCSLRVALQQRFTSHSPFPVPRRVYSMNGVLPNSPRFKDNSSCALWARGFNTPILMGPSRKIHRKSPSRCSQCRSSHQHCSGKIQQSGCARCSRLRQPCQFSSEITSTTQTEQLTPALIAGSMNSPHLIVGTETVGDSYVQETNFSPTETAIVSGQGTPHPSKSIFTTKLSTKLSIERSRAKYVGLASPKTCVFTRFISAAARDAKTERRGQSWQSLVRHFGRFGQFRLH
ncbi:uncharacterized protein EI90DRAFT_73757 [Cantharellus anzutake]|uniref:uncharacterized protein n=1 Tax=Cantharellus anzutake TaxID=1750568 RepID=UPI0019082A6E|nr:uncharacterized protein EI90DRAFT_73757 [Cantharellus anzutake]KAF8336813.1 hypothetical protein EI90DRAFT_73757 [Cantharellus anzutake]